MRRVLIATVSFAALALGPSFALAQGGPGGGHAGGEHGPEAGGEPHQGGGMGGGGRTGGGGMGAHGEPGRGPAVAPQAGGARPDGRPAATGEPSRAEARPAAAGPAGAGRAGGERAAGGHGRGGGPEHLSAEQREHVHGAVRGERIGHPDFAVRTGVIIPERYHFLPLPPLLIDLYPEYRGFDYVLVGDEIIILEPGTRRIVDIIED